MHGGRDLVAATVIASRAGTTELLRQLANFVESKKGGVADFS
ncbi:hypothetical protein [Bradyrhizobium altum]|nr:hypothetical protein [Bradyrhizobium altum]